MGTPTRTDFITVQFRCTLPDSYPRTSPGYADKSARQGYFARAATARDAVRQIRARLGLNTTTPVDVDIWGL